MYLSNMIFHLTFIKVWLIIIHYSIHCYKIKIEESPQYNFFDNIEDLSKRSFWYHSKWHQDEPLGHVVFIFLHLRGTLWLLCVHIAQLMTHPSGYTLWFTLQLCYKHLGVLQRVPKSLKVHFSRHDRLQTFTTSSLLNIGPRVPPEWGRSNRNLPFSH